MQYESNIMENVKFRLPTKEEFERLSMSFSRFDDEKKGRYYLDQASGGVVFLPCKGHCVYSLENRPVDESYGYYLSSDGSAYSLGRDFTGILLNATRNNFLCARLVSDTPFEGSIPVNGIYWKPENEAGYFSLEKVRMLCNIGRGTILEKDHKYYVALEKLDPECVFIDTQELTEIGKKTELGYVHTNLDYRYCTIVEDKDVLEAVQLFLESPEDILDPYSFISGFCKARNL